jgi:hypothetical protein
MRKFGYLLGVALLFACATGAQVNPANSLSLPSPAASSAASLPAAPLPSTVLAANTAISGRFLASNETALAFGEAPPATPQPAEPPQGVQGVFQTYEWQAYVGYTYVRFFQVPGTEINTNGFNFSVQYYFYKDWIAADGEFVSTFGSQFGSTANYLMGLGGIRLRKSGPRGIELWAHLLGGGAHYTPQTAYGGEGSLAYEAGGGIDIDAHHHRLAYRLAVDAAGTNFFHTYQVSPKVSAGVVFKF